MAGTLVSYLPFTRSVTEDLSGKEWTVTGEPRIVTLNQFPYKAAQFEPGQKITTNIEHGGSSTWMVEFWCFIPPITTSWESIIWTGSDDLFFNMLSIDSDGKLTVWSNTNETFSGSYAFISKSDNTYFNRWIKIQFGWIYATPVFGASAEIYDYNDQHIEYFNTASSYNSPQVTSPISTSGIIRLASNITMKIGQFRYYSSINKRRYDYEFFPSITTTLPTDNIISNELLVHDTINFESRNNISYTSRNKSQQWVYKNPGSADGLLVSGTSLTNVDPLKSVTSKAFYQTNRQKCFDTQASKEIYMLFDVYFDGSKRWRAYEESSTNGITGITAQTSGEVNIFSNGTNVGASIPLTINKLETYLLYMRSDATNGYIEVYKNGELKYTYIGNVNNGDDFSNLELQSDGSGTIFSNIVISNQPIDDADRWTGNYNNIQRTLTNETWVPEKCLKAYLPCTNTITEDFCGNTWTVTGTTPTIVTTNYLNGKATQFGKGYIYTNPPAFRSNNFTIDFWEYIPSTINGLTAQMVVIDGTDGTGTQCLDIGYDNGATVPSLWLGKGTSSGWKYSNKIIGTKIRDKWVHRAVVRYNDKIYAFENGQLYTSFDIESNMYIDITGNSLFIGGFKRASRLHPGMLSEVRVYVGTGLWTENFTPPNQEDYFEIYWYFNKPAPILNTNYDIQRTLTNATWVKEKCLKAYLTTTNNSITDLCGNQWNTYNNPSVAKTNYLNGNAISFSNKAYLEYNNGITLGGRSFTISGWFNMASNTGNWSRVFQLFTATGSETNTIRIARNNNNQNIVFTFYNATLTGTTSYAISYNTWYHFAFVYDHTNSKVYIYINGEQILSGNQTIPETNFTLWLGRSNYSADGYFVGQIAEFMIHKKVALYTENFTPPTQEDYFDTYWYFNQPAPILNTNYNTLRYLTNNSITWKYINPGYNDISPFTYTNSSVTQVQARNAYTDMQVSGDINLNADIYQDLYIKFDIYLGNSLGTIFSFPYGKGTISISISKPESSTTYLAKILHERNEENPIGTQLSPETSYSDYELGKIDEEISFIIYIKSDAYNKGEIIIDSSSWIDTDDNRRVALFSTGGRFHLNNANINEGNSLSKTLNVKCIYNLIVSNQELAFDDMIAHNINPTQRSIINNEEWRREKYYYHTYLPFDENVTKDLNGDTWQLTNTLDIQNNTCYFNGSGYLWKSSNNLANKPFTVSFYMSATSNNTGKEPYIFQLYLSKTFGVIVHLIGCKITTNGKLVFCRDFNDNRKNDFYLITSFSILDGKMHYIECIYTGSKCLFFVDGILIGTANSVIENQNHGLFLGRNADTNTSFTGYLDEFRIYSGYIAHTEAFTPPVYHQINDKLYYDKSAETMKFEYFADIIKNVINIPLTIRNMFLRHYIPLHNDLDDKVNNVNTQFYSTIESVDAVFTNNSLNLQKYSSDGNEENNNYNGFGITNLTNLLKFKFILQARLFDVQFYRTPDGILTNNIFSIFGQGFEQILLMVGHRNSLLFQADVGKRYSKSVSLINNFQLTIVYDYNNLQIIISPIDTNMDIIKAEVFYQIDLSQCQPDFNKNINEILFGSKVGSLGTPNAIHYLNEIKIYQDFNPDLSSNIIDNYITYQFNNNEESVYFEFYADIDISKPMIININPSILCWYYLQENKKLRIQGSQAFILPDSFYRHGIKDLKSYPSLEQYQFLEDSRTNGNIVYSVQRLSIPIQIDYLPYTLFFWLETPWQWSMWLNESHTWELEAYSTEFLLYNHIDETSITIARNTASLSNNWIYHLALVLENSEASLYVNGSYVDTIYNLTVRGEWVLTSSNEATGFYGFGAIKGNIFKNGNVNLGYIGCPPSYVISTSDSQVSKPRLALQHNDKTYYNKLVSSTDENASKIRIYHNDTVYALSK